MYYYPTDPFTISEPYNQEISEFYVVRGRRTTDFEAPKLGKGPSGNTNLHFAIFAPKNSIDVSGQANFLKQNKNDIFLLKSNEILRTRSFMNSKFIDRRFM